MEISPNALGFRFEISQVEETRYTGGNSGYTIHFVIANTEAKARQVTVSKANYVTKSGEQFEQDNWLTGTLIESGRIQGGAQRKCGLIFFKNNVKTVSEGDSIHLEIGVPDRSKKLNLKFEIIKDSVKGTTLGVLTEMQAEECDDASSPEKKLLKKVERLEVFEERAGVKLEGLCVRISPDSNRFEVNGELYPRDGLHLSRTVELVFTIYGKDGGVLSTTSQTFYKDSFYGFEPFSVDIYNVEASKVGKIRVYPNSS